MQTPQTRLFYLVQALTPAEQRAFAYYAHRHSPGRAPAYYSLYEILRRQERYDEDLARSALGLDKGHFAVVRRHLYEHLLDALVFYFGNCQNVPHLSGCAASSSVY